MAFLDRAITQIGEALVRVPRVSKPAYRLEPDRDAGAGGSSTGRSAVGVRADATRHVGKTPQAASAAGALTRQTRFRGRSEAGDSRPQQRAPRWALLCRCMSPQRARHLLQDGSVRFPSHSRGQPPPPPVSSLSCGNAASPGPVHATVVATSMCTGYYCRNTLLSLV